MISDAILVYDVQSIPEFSNRDYSDSDIIVKVYEQKKIVLWDSTKGGIEPKIVLVGKDFPIGLKLVNTKDLSKEEIQHLIEKRDE